MQGIELISLLLIGIGSAAFVWFLIPLCVTGSVNIGIITGMGLSALLILYGIWMVPVNEFLAGLWQTVLGRILEICAIIVAAVVLGLAIACIGCMIRGASKRESQGGTVIVLGARVYHDHIGTSLKGRLDAAISYLEKNPASVVIVSGGMGRREARAEAPMMKEYLISQGIQPGRIYMEDRSFDTRENLAFSKVILEENHLDFNLVIATEGYHQYRASRYAAEVGLEVSSLSSSTAWWLFPSSVIREMYGILELWFLN